MQSVTHGLTHPARTHKHRLPFPSFGKPCASPPSALPWPPWPPPPAPSCPRPPSPPAAVSARLSDSVQARPTWLALVRNGATHECTPQTPVYALLAHTHIQMWPCAPRAPLPAAPLCSRRSVRGEVRERMMMATSRESARQAGRPRRQAHLGPGAHRRDRFIMFERRP